MVELPSDAPSPRICLVKKDWPEQEYGYNLHAERGKGQFIGNVDAGSPADKAGLRAGDRIFAVNGANITNETHKQVVGRIKENPLQCELLVIDEGGERWYRENKIDITPDLPNIIRNGQPPVNAYVGRAADPEPTPVNGSSNGYAASSSPSPMDASSTSPPPPQWYAPPAATTRVVEPVRSMATNPDGRPLPRLSHLVKKTSDDEFGFNLHAEKGRGHFIGKVDSGGIGDKAGLVMGQRIVGVNGELIFPSTPHKDVVYLIKKDSMHAALLVASEDVDQWYKERGAQYSFDLAETFGEQPSSISHHHQPAPPTFTYIPPTVVEPDPSDSSSSEDESEAAAESDQEEDRHHRQPSPAVAAVTIPPPDYESPSSRVTNGHHTPPPQLKYQEHKPEPMHVQAPMSEKVQPEPSPPSYATVQKPVSSSTTTTAPRSTGPVKPQISPSGNPQLDSAFGMSAAQMRAQLAQRKKVDPRKDTSLSIQEKHRVVTNM